MFLAPSADKQTRNYDTHIYKWLWLGIPNLFVITQSVSSKPISDKISQTIKR